MIDDNTPCIYVACLAAYNDGHLHGVWIDVTEDSDAIWESINAMLKRSPVDGAEEWAIHAFDGFGSFTLSESSSIDDVIAYAAFITEHGEDLGSAVLSYFNDLEYAKKLFEEAYCGVYDSEADFVEQMAQDVYTIPEELEYYIDYERMARDWFINDYFSVDLGYQSVHVFRHL